MYNRFLKISRYLSRSLKSKFIQKELNHVQKMPPAADSPYETLASPIKSENDKKLYK